MNLSRKQVQIDMKELQKEVVLVREDTNRSGRWVVTNAGKMIEVAFMTRASNVFTREEPEIKEQLNAES